MHHISLISGIAASSKEKISERCCRERVQKWVDGGVDRKHKDCNPDVDHPLRIIELSNQRQDANHDYWHPAAEVGQDDEEQTFGQGDLSLSVI